MKIFQVIVRLLFRLFGVYTMFSKKAEVPIKEIWPHHRPDFIKMCEYARLPRDTYPPIVCHKNGDYYLILDGHHRWYAAKRRGDETVRIKYFQ
jgi:hypothetical protein